MGGGGSGGYIPPHSDTLKEKLSAVDAEEQKRLDQDVNAFLGEVLAKFNDRDAELTRERINVIADALGDEVEIEELLLGGSVAKHTYVDGMSDVDALVIFAKKELEGKGPVAIRNQMCRILRDALGADEVQSVESGTLAVTVEYRDSSEVQLLPALRSGTTVQIADTSGKRWKEIDPKRFQRSLTRANERLKSGLVPAIKLIKSITGAFPDPRKLTGPHVEAIALDAAKNYEGACTPKALVLHLLRHAEIRVLRPVRDVTSQSRYIDEYMGKSDSVHRRAASQGLASIRRRLESTTSVAQWKLVFKEN